MTLRIRLLLLLVLLFAATSLRPALTVGPTLTALIFDGSTWSVPAPIQMAVLELREQGHEIRVVDVDVTNGEDQEPAELAPALRVARQRKAPTLAFQTGAQVAAGDPPLDKQAFIEAVQ